MSFLKTSLLLAALTALFMGVGYLIGGSIGMAIAFIIAMVTNLYAYWNSDKVALRMHNAEPASSSSSPRLARMVDKLAQNADLPTPAIYMINSDQPNAFATGRSPNKAAVAVTAGLLRLLDDDEIEGVIAHELAHIKHYDTLTMTIAASVAGAISMLAQFGMFFRGGRRGALGFGGVILAAVFAPFAAMLIQMLISRTREYAADRMGAEISGDPMGLASALRKISSNVSKIAMPSAERYPTSAHLFIHNPLTGQGIDNMFSTHPNVANRIAALEEMARLGEYPSISAVRRLR